MGSRYKDGKVPKNTLRFVVGYKICKYCTIRLAMRSDSHENGSHITDAVCTATDVGFLDLIGNDGNLRGNRPQ